MKKSTKGALAIGAAAILLMGGGTTLAFWTADATAEGGSITHGTLDLADGTCDDTWFHADGGTLSDEAVELVVPGDQIGKTCTFLVEATGDHLAATLDAPETLTWTATDGGALPPDSTFTSTVSADYTLTGAAEGATPAEVADGGTITEEDDGATLAVTFLVDIPYGGDTAVTDDVNQNENGTQSLEAALDTLTVTLTQTDH